MKRKMERRDFLGLAAVIAGGGLAGHCENVLVPSLSAATPKRKTEVSIRRDGFLINGHPTYKGRSFNGRKIEGLLMNVRAVQGIFDDANPETRSRWVYPDTGIWDPERNTAEFLEALPSWRQNGLLAFTINLQGGTPGAGVGQRAAVPPAQTPNSNPPGTPAGDATRGARGGGPPRPPLENTAINPDGSLRSNYMQRLERVINRADELGIVVILGYFYFGQDNRVQDEPAVKQTVLNATNWILDRGYKNVLVEVNNECGNGYHHEILRPARVHELIQFVKDTKKNGRRLLVATSWPGPDSKGPRENPDTPVTSNVLRVSDFALIHGNGPADPDLTKKMIIATRALPGYHTMPVLINEDPNFHFDEPDNHIMTALDGYVSWGYYDQGQNNYIDGYQSPPVNWGINTDNKKQFFAKVKDITGA